MIWVINPIAVWFSYPFSNRQKSGELLLSRWTLYGVIPSNPKIHNGNDLRRNMKCYSIWSESNLAFLPLAIISSVANDGAFLSQVILRKSIKFDKVPEMLENDRAWNLTGADKSAFIPIESNSFGKWIAKDQSIISIKNWTSDVGYIFIHRPVVNLVIPVGPSAFHGSIVVHIPF